MVGRLPIASAVLIVVISIIAGPHVSVVDFPRESNLNTSAFCDSTGSATVEVLEVPTDSFELKQRRFDVDTYYVDADLASVKVNSVKGCPSLVYSLEIPGLNFFSQRVALLAGRTGDEVLLSIVKGKIDPSAVTKQEYYGNLTILVRGDATRIVYQENVTVTRAE